MMVESNNNENIYEISSVDEMYDNNNMDIIPINYFSNKLCNKCCSEEFTIKDFTIIYDIILSLNLSNLEKNLILVRFRRINLFCIKNYKSIANYYSKSKIFIIICGILNPSLLSINNNQNDKFYTLLFWIIWGLQLSVSLITSFISFYKWDKKYFLYSSYKSKINQEIWLYLELTGKYGTSIIDQNNNNNNNNNNNIIIEASHKNKLNLFLERIESLFKKLKDFDLEIENNDEDNKENNNNKKYYKKKKEPNPTPNDGTSPNVGTPSNDMHV